MKNEIDILSLCLKRLTERKSTSPCHIALFTAIYKLWREQGGQRTVYVTRSELMLLTGIKSTATYHKTLKYLVSIGLIVYHPSFNPILGSSVEFQLLD